MADRKTQLALFAIAVIIMVAGVLYLGSRDGPDEGNESYPNLTLMGRDGEEEMLTYDDLVDMVSISGSVKYQNRVGNWGESGEFTGVRISDLVELVGGMKPGDVLRVTSNDGYLQEYSYYNVYPDYAWHELQGDFILAYGNGNREIPDWEDGPMTVFVPQDGELSNEDVKHTSAPGQGYFANPSAGARFVRNSWMIEVVGGQGSEWTLLLQGTTNKTLSRTEFGSIAAEFRENVTDASGTDWSGVALWRILALIDGGPARGEGSFNQSYALEGYEVRVSGKETLNLVSRDLIGNSSVILADIVGGVVLDKPSLVVPVEIIEDLTDMALFPLWEVAISGALSANIHYSELIQSSQESGTGYYLKSTGTVVGPFDMRGIPILSVLESIGELPENYSLEVTATDGYSITLSMEEAAGNVNVYNTDGSVKTVGGVTATLVYEMDGSNEFDGGPLRLAYIGDGNPITDGHYWIKEVVKIRVKEAVKQWSIELVGLSEFLLNRTTFESAATCEKHRVVLNHTSNGETHKFQGLPLWVVLSIVDGNIDPDGHWFFNDDLARDGYDVKITASDDFSTTLNSTFVWRNDGIVVAFLRDDDVLPSSEWPLRLIGNELTGKQSVRNIVRIEILLPGED